MSRYASIFAFATLFHHIALAQGFGNGFYGSSAPPLTTASVAAQADTTVSSRPSVRFSFSPSNVTVHILPSIISTSAADATTAASSSFGGSGGSYQPSLNFTTVSNTTVVDTSCTSTMYSVSNGFSISINNAASSHLSSYVPAILTTSSTSTGSAANGTNTYTSLSPTSTSCSNAGYVPFTSEATTIVKTSTTYWNSSSIVAPVASSSYSGLVGTSAPPSLAGPSVWLSTMISFGSGTAINSATGNGGSAAPFQTTLLSFASIPASLSVSTEFDTCTSTTSQDLVTPITTPIATGLGTGSYSSSSSIVTSVASSLSSIANAASTFLAIPASFTAPPAPYSYSNSTLGAPNGTHTAVTAITLGLTSTNFQTLTASSDYTTILPSGSTVTSVVTRISSITAAYSVSNSSVAAPTRGSSGVSAVTLNCTSSTLLTTTATSANPASNSSTYLGVSDFSTLTVTPLPSNTSLASRGTTPTAASEISAAISSALAGITSLAGNGNLFPSVVIAGSGNITKCVNLSSAIAQITSLAGYNASSAVAGAETANATTSISPDSIIAEISSVVAEFTSAANMSAAGPPDTFATATPPPALPILEPTWVNPSIVTSAAPLGFDGEPTSTSYATTAATSDFVSIVSISAAPSGLIGGSTSLNYYNVTSNTTSAFAWGSGYSFSTMVTQTVTATTNIPTPPSATQTASLNRSHDDTWLSDILAWAAKTIGDVFEKADSEP